MLELLQPTTQYGASYLKQMRRKMAKGRHPVDGFALSNLDHQIARWKELAQDPENGRYEYWLVDEKEYIGTFQLRREPSGMVEPMASHVYWGIDNPEYQDAATLSALFELGLQKAKANKFSSLIVLVAETDLIRTKIIENHGGVPVASVDSVTDGSRLAKYHVDIP